MSHSVWQIFVEKFPKPIQKSAADKFIIYKLLIVLSFSFLTKAFRTIKFPNIVAKLKWNVWLHWCWWQMLKTKCVGDGFCRLLVEVVFILPSGTNIQKMSPRSRLCHQHPKTVANITVIFLVIVKWFSDNVKCQHELVNSRKIGFDFDLIESWKKIVFAFNINYMV